MKLKNAKPARVHLLPKIHKEFTNVPKFRPIIDTTGTTHCLVGKFLSQLLSPLTQNDFTLKDSFDAAGRIRMMHSELFQDHKYVSFDVESLFTSVPLEQTINVNVSFKRIYTDKLVTS